MQKQNTPTMLVSVMLTRSAFKIRVHSPSVHPRILRCLTFLFLCLLQAKLALVLSDALVSENHPGQHEKRRFPVQRHQV